MLTVCPHCKEVFDASAAHKVDPAPIALIIETVARYKNIPPYELLLKNRKQKYVNARRYIMWLATIYTELSIYKIAIVLNRKHTTALHSLNNINKRLDKNSPRLCYEVRELMSLLAAQNYLPVNMHKVNQSVKDTAVKLQYVNFKTPQKT